VSGLWHALIIIIVVVSGLWHALVIIIIKMGLATDDLIVCSITFKWTVHYMSYKMDLEKK
jgi:hypothetical protein